MEKALAEGPGAGSEFPSFASSPCPRWPAGRAVAGLTQRAASPGTTQRRSGGPAGLGGSAVGSTGQRHRHEAGSTSYSPCKFKKSPAKCWHTTTASSGGSARQGREGRKEKLVLRLSLGTSVRGTRGPARDRLRDSGGESRVPHASSAAAHGSEQPSWATPGPGKGAAAISVPGESPPRITLPYSSAPPLALASRNHRGSDAPSSSGAFSGESSRVPGRRGGWPRSPLALLATGPSSCTRCGQLGVRSHLGRRVPGPRATSGVARHPGAQARLLSALRAGLKLRRGRGSRGQGAEVRTAGRSSLSGVCGAPLPRRPQ